MNKKKHRLVTSESVTEGHPDKICDQISDGILDAMLEQDENTHAGIECFCTSGLVLVGGEAKTNAYVNINNIVRNILNKIGYNDSSSGFCWDSVGIISTLHEQSVEIADGVDKKKGDFKEQGAGDQGLMHGYATNETKELMPLPIILAHKLTKKLSQVRKNKKLKYLRPDGKSQVTVEYNNGKALRVETVVIAAQHDDIVTTKKLHSDIKKYVIEPVLGSLLDKKTKIFINSTGRFIIGGPVADAGLTGRKIIVDTYGGIGAHGGGAFSGKDASKVDRSGAYMARYVAKNIVAAKLAAKCEIQVAYAIGVADPVGIYIDTFGTSKISEEDILEKVKKIFDFRPSAIIKKLDLKRNIFSKTSVYGHFGRSGKEFTWEQTDKVKDLLNN